MVCVVWVLNPTMFSRRPSRHVDLRSTHPLILKDYLLIVNCTPSGMYPHTETCPNLPYEALTPDHLLYDLVYNPLETLFMKKGKAAGATVKNGLEMLHLQAEKLGICGMQRKRSKKVTFFFSP